MKKYVVITELDGEKDMTIETEKRLAELWETDQNCGIYDSIKAYEYINGKMTEVNVYGIAQAWLSDRDAIEKEYRDYCATVR